MNTMMRAILVALLLSVVGITGSAQLTRMTPAPAVLAGSAAAGAYFDYVLFRRELEREGIPHLLLEYEEKMFTFDRLQMEIETFVESLLFA